MCVSARKGELSSEDKGMSMIHDESRQIGQTQLVRHDDDGSIDFWHENEIRDIFLCV